MAIRKIIHWVQGQAQTVGAVTVTVASFDLASAATAPDNLVSDNCGIRIEANIQGHDAGSNDTGGKTLARGFKRIAGTVSATDAAAIAVVTNTLPGNLATATFDIDFSGTVIRLRATGVAARTIDWFGDIVIRIFNPV